MVDAVYLGRRDLHAIGNLSDGSAFQDTCAKYIKRKGIKVVENALHALELFVGQSSGCWTGRRQSRLLRLPFEEFFSPEGGFALAPEPALDTLLSDGKQRIAF